MTILQFHLNKIVDNLQKQKKMLVKTLILINNKVFFALNFIKKKRFSFFQIRVTQNVQFSIFLSIYIEVFF